MAFTKGINYVYTKKLNYAGYLVNFEFPYVFF